MRDTNQDVGDALVREPTISAYIQCHSNKTALYHTLSSFRKCYPAEDITLVSDCGEDFSSFAAHFRLKYYRSTTRCDPRGNLGEEGTAEYLKRVYQHCVTTSSDYVVILEEDVTTRRRIRHFPTTDCGGPRLNRFTDELNRYLQEVNHSTQDYGYAMCGGSIFDRRVFLTCYEKDNFDLAFLATLDRAIIQYSDVPLTVIFLVNGYSYGVWDEVSEAHHPEEQLRIFRDAAFDHNDKRWYGVEFDESILQAPRRGAQTQEG